MPGVTLIKGDATERWPLEDNTLDSIVTDPPYGIAFMGKSWDDKGGPLAYQAWTTTWAREAFRCLKPGGFLLAFGATRMAHRMTCGFEDAGFEILDGIEWLHLQGMPKAQDIGKLFDKRAGAEREVTGKGINYDAKMRHGGTWTGNLYGTEPSHGKGPLITAPATDLAKQWDGWKTPSLKPAHEPIVVARKPLVGTYCENLEQWGVGAINVDGCRIGNETILVKHIQTGGSNMHFRYSGKAQPSRTEDGKRITTTHQGRFPANVVMSHGPDCTPEACQDGCPVKVLDAQSEPRMHSAGFARTEKRECEKTGRFWKNAGDGHRFGDGGGASKVFAKFFWDQDDYAAFYYCPKASQRDRNEGCTELPEGNNHATVKPTGLIRYLQRLVTPPGGLTGSPFLGSGTDAVAAIREGIDFWGMNLPDRPGEEYWPIIDARVAHALKAEGEPRKPAETTAQTAPPAVPEQVRFAFDQAGGAVQGHPCAEGDPSPQQQGGVGLDTATHMASPPQTSRGASCRTPG